VVANERGSGRALARIVSVRTDDPMLAAVRELAAKDGVTVSDWMRRAVGCAVHERHQPPAIPGHHAIGWQCPHLSITSTPGTLGKAAAWCGCEMQPVYAAA
jgi:hypothetical protein